MLSEDERTIYKSIRELEATLRNGADIKELHDCRDIKVKRTLRYLFFLCSKQV